jgi:hypothetical protein
MLLQNCTYENHYKWHVSHGSQFCGPLSQTNLNKPRTTMKNIKTAGNDQDLNGIFLEQNTTSSQCFE